MLKPGKMGEAQRRVRRANEYLKAGDLNNAELWFEEALALDPNNRKALAGLGKVARLKKIKEHLSQGLSLLDQGRLGDAEKQLRQVLSLEPKNSDAIEGLRRIAQLRKPAATSRVDERKSPQPPLQGGERSDQLPSQGGEIERAGKAVTRRVSVDRRGQMDSRFRGNDRKGHGDDRERHGSDRERSWDDEERTQGIEKAEAFVEYLARNRMQSRRRSLDFLLISAAIHIIVFLVLSFFIREVIHTPRDEIPVEWVRVDDPKAPSYRPLKIAPEKKVVFDPRLSEERAIKSLADRAAKSNIQSPRPSLLARESAPKAGPGAQPQMFSAVEIPTSDEDMVFSPRETMALGSRIGKPSALDHSGTAATGKGIGGLSTLEAATTFGDEVSGLALGGLGGRGLMGPDPLDMVSAVTFGRQDQENVVFLLDISNSMEGNYQRGVYNREWFKKLKRAKRSIISSLYRLRSEEDKFYLVAFSSGFKVFNEEPVAANESNLAKATDFIQELSPTTHRERTDLYGALEAALKVDPTRIILVSDGLPTEGVVSIRNILKGVRQKAKATRIYTFATNLGGREEAQTLLSRLAKENSGRFKNDKMGLPRGIAVSSDGHIYVADVTVNMFDSAGHRTRSFGSHTIKLAIGPSDDIHLLFFPSARSSGFGALGVCRADGTQLRSFASHGYLPRQVDEPWDVAADSKGRTYVVSTRMNRISVFDRDGEFVRSFGSAGMQAYKTGPHERGDSLTGGGRGGSIARHGVNSGEPGYFSRPMGVALDSRDNIYVLDSGNRRVQIFDPQFQLTGKFPIDGHGIAIDVDAEGNYIYVLLGSGSTGGEKVYIYRPNGGLVEKFDVGSGTADIDAVPSGEIYALSFVYDEVNVFSSKGERLRSFSTIQ